MLVRPRVAAAVTVGEHLVAQRPQDPQLLRVVRELAYRVVRLHAEAEGVGACGVLGHVVRRLAKRVVDVRVDEAVDALVDIDHTRPLPCDFIGLHQRGVRVPHLVVPIPNAPTVRAACTASANKPQLDALARTQRGSPKARTSRRRRRRRRRGRHCATRPECRKPSSGAEETRSRVRCRQPQPHPRRRAGQTRWCPALLPTGEWARAPRGRRLANPIT